jgi:hypothetical protein
MTKNMNGLAAASRELIAKAVAEEREACAKVAESRAPWVGTYAAINTAAAIRNRVAVTAGKLGT